ncbi:hypothetical protein KSS87_015456 [Heliosperma pusillum]|nr:hypothetical protein KSS87_015456 [Heliosperma pusillum]
MLMWQEEKEQYVLDFPPTGVWKVNVDTTIFCEMGCELSVVIQDHMGMGVVDAVPVAVPKPDRKGGRGAENEMEKAVSAKKQKLERDETVSAKQKPYKQQPKKPAVSSSDDDSDDSDSGSHPKVQASKKSDRFDKSSDEDGSDEEKEQTSTKKDTDVEMVNAEKSSASTFQKTPKTQATPEPIVSKTLYVGNLSFSVGESDVREFFKDAGDVVDIRFSRNSDGKFRGFGHVEFAKVEAAMELNDQELLGRPVRLDYARERSDLSPQSRVQGQTAFVRGFDTSLGENEIRSALQEHFGSCGEITRISIRLDHESGGVKKMAYMDFANRSGLEAALQKNDSDLGGGFYLNVQEAKSRGDSVGGRVDRGGKSGERGRRDGGLEAALQKNDSDLGGGFYLNVQEAKSRDDSVGGRVDRGGKSGERGRRDGGLEAALQKNDSDLGGGFDLNVQEAKSRGDSVGGRVDRGGKSGERGRHDGGRFNGRGGRDGGRGGRFSGRGGRDGGTESTPYKSTVPSGSFCRESTPYKSTVPSGKKKTFWDD